LLAGYFGEMVDDIIGYLMSTCWHRFRLLLLLIAFIQAVRDSEALSRRWFEGVGIGPRQKGLCATFVLVLVVIGVTTWIGLCRLVRAEVIKHKNREYVQAARALGCGHTRVIFQAHPAQRVSPGDHHVHAGFVGSVGLRSSSATWVSASSQHLHTWGQVISAARRNELQREPSVWWPLASATAILFVLSLSFSLFGDALRDALDPKLRT
jgi:peptide/nickel transport system permease protein